MKRKVEERSVAIAPGGIDEYIEQMPAGARLRLREIRNAIQEAAPGSTETVRYFQIPGYFYEGYDYNGMFAWFSFKPPYVRLHVRPPVLEDHKKDLGDWPTTAAIVSFPASETIPKPLVKKLVRASVKVMKQSGKKPGLNPKTRRVKKDPHQPPAPTRQTRRR